MSRTFVTWKSLVKSEGPRLTGSIWASLTNYWAAEPMLQMKKVKFGRHQQEKSYLRHLTLVNKDLRRESSKASSGHQVERSEEEIDKIVSLEECNLHSREGCKEIGAGQERIIHALKARKSRTTI